MTISPEPVVLRVFVLMHHWTDHNEKRTDVTLHLNVEALVATTKAIVYRHFVSDGGKLDEALDSNNFIEITEALSHISGCSHRFELHSCSLAIG